jgi:cyclohexa-1,5-dienecarbonyl-CoA hydratase
MESDKSWSSIAFENDGRVARLRLERPPLNILTIAMIQEIRRALASLDLTRGLRAVVLSAEGKAFCAGVSVEEHLPPTTEAMIECFHAVFRQLRALSCPTLAVVEGAALGGGCELACFADVVIATEAATFGVPEIKLGVLPPIAAVHFPSRIGLARTLQLVLSGATIDAREALRIGLVDEVVAAEQAEAAVQARLEAFRCHSVSALRLAKRAVLAGAGDDFEERLRAVERLYLDQLVKTPDAVEGLKAFLEKRPPVWTR